MQQRFVHVIGKHDELVIDVARPQKLNQADRLREIHVPVIVAVDEQHRRLPRVDLRDRRSNFECA